VIKSIKGDVTDDLHLTVLYGFNKPSEKEKIKDYIDKTELEDLEIEGIDFYRVIEGCTRFWFYP